MMSKATTRQRYIGVIAPYDFALDREIWKWAPKRVTLMLTRTSHLGLPSTVAMAEGISSEYALRSRTQALLTAEPDVVLYLCTSGSFVRGADAERQMREVMIDAGAREAVTTSGSLVTAAHALGVRRLAVATPYIDTVTDKLRDFLGESGLEVVGDSRLGRDERIWQIETKMIRRLVRAADRPDADAVFISCTNLRTYGLIRELEAELGKPVLTANQVSVWNALRVAGITQPNLEQRLFLDTRSPDQHLSDDHTPTTALVPMPSEQTLVAAVPENLTFDATQPHVAGCGGHRVEPTHHGGEHGARHEAEVRVE